MPLSIGTTLGSYGIVALIGAGGMGEVYRARDTKLGRDVALKVLPEPFAADPDRLARFLREARVLASLNHPHIATIHGFEESSGVHALVMELVEGPTLADRIAQGPVPLEETLQIAKQIADALEAAHERGIIHRDLKPANIKLTRDGTVKVLDFGLAKELDADRRDVRVVGEADRCWRAHADRRDRRHGRATWPRSRRRENLSTSGPTSGRSAWCSTKCLPGDVRFRATPLPTRWPRS